MNTTGGMSRWRHSRRFGNGRHMTSFYGAHWSSGRNAGFPVHMQRRRAHFRFIGKQMIGIIVGWRSSLGPRREVRGRSSFGRLGWMRP